MYHVYVACHYVTFCVVCNVPEKGKNKKAKNRMFFGLVEFENVSLIAKL